MSSKEAKVHKMHKSGFRQVKKLTRMERLEKSVKQLAGLPQFLLQRFQELTKVVEDLRFTYEVVGILLQEKNIISQEEVNAVGARLIEERREKRGQEMKERTEEAERKTAELKAKEQMEDGVEGEVVETLTQEQVEKELMEGESSELRNEVAKQLMQSREDLQDSQIQDVDVSVKARDLEKAGKESKEQKTDE